MSCDKHLTHPERWPGDCGAVAEALSAFSPWDHSRFAGGYEIVGDHRGFEIR